MNRAAYFKSLGDRRFAYQGPGALEMSESPAGRPRLVPPALPEWPGPRPSPTPPPGAEVDVLLPLGHGSAVNDAELIFALRSIERHAAGYRRVVVAGECPAFLDLDCPRLAHVPLPDGDGNHEYRIARKLQRALATGSTTEWVAMWNDDYVLTRPTDVRAIPFLQKGPLLSSTERQRVDRYTRALSLTRRLLAASGRPTLNYDIHVPMLLQRDLFMWLAPWWHMSGQTRPGLVVKSVYANTVLEEPGGHDPDLKLKTFDPATVEAQLSTRWVFSYDDRALNGGLLDWLKREYPRRSCFEKERW